MEASPLTRQLPPEVFTPKIVELYGHLLKEDDENGIDGNERTEGYWKEFFLLNPDRRALRSLFDALSPSDTLVLEDRTRELFRQSIATVKGGGELAALHALETLSVFLSSLLSKKYAHPSSDTIAVLAGLDQIDAVFTDFVGALNGIVRTGKSLEMRSMAVEVLLAITAGAYQTTLLTYLIQRDLFPSVMRLISDSQEASQVLEPFTLIGLLANYNKFEFQNPYQLRLNDFVNEATIRKIVACVGYTCQNLRAGYILIQDDMPEAWNLGQALSRFGLGALGGRQQGANRKVAHDEQTTKDMFAKLPSEDAALLLATYDFAHANKLFCFSLVTLAASEPTEESPLTSYLSVTSYLLHHAHLSGRTAYYAHLNLMVLRLLVEDPNICKRFCADEDSAKCTVRLCRHRPPFLPLVKGERVPAAALLDVMVDGVMHNLRRRLDVGLYTLCVGIMLRVISHLSRSRTRLKYHWSELFRALLSLIKFLTTYASDLRDASHIDNLIEHVVNVLALSLSTGEAFLPTPAAYDDLFYKAVESGETLVKFKESYSLSGSERRHGSSIDTLINVTAHYKQMLADRGAAGGSGSRKIKPSSLTTGQVTEVIKQGYETLSIQAKEGLDTWERYREADERTLLKKMARATVGDARELVQMEKKRSLPG